MQRRVLNKMVRNYVPVAMKMKPGPKLAVASNNVLVVGFRVAEVDLVGGGGTNNQ